MNEKEYAAVACACEFIRQSVKVCVAAGISGKAINMVLIGLAGIKKELKGETKGGKDEHIAGI